MHRFYLVFLLLITVFLSCKAEEIDSIMNEVSGGSPADVETFFKKYNVKAPSDIIFKDVNLYYPMALLIKKNPEKIGYHEYLLQQSYKTNSIFTKRSLRDHICFLAENNRINEIPSILKENRQEIDADLMAFFENVFSGQFPETLLKDKSLNQLKLINYITTHIDLKKLSSDNKRLIKSYIADKYSEDFLKENKDLIKDINTKLGSDYVDFILKAYERDTNIALYLKKAIDDAGSIEQLGLLGKIAASAGLKRDFSFQIGNLAKTDNNALYIYTHDLGATLGRRKAYPFYKYLLTKFQDVSEYNYQIKAKIYYNDYNLSKDYIADIVEYSNQYPDKFHSIYLLKSVIRDALLLKNSSIGKAFENLDYKKLSAINAQTIMYSLYLLSSDDKYKNILLTEYPLSYGALKINNNNIQNILVSAEKDDNNKNSIKDNQYYKMANYLAKFGIDVDVDEYGDKINSTEKYHILNMLYDYYISTGDNYKALNTAKEIAILKYDYNLTKIDMTTLRRLFPTPYEDAIDKYSQKYGVDKALCYAVMREESNFHPGIVSSAKAMGLMQIMPSTGEWLSGLLKLEKYDLNNPENNINMGVYYLKFLERYFKDDGLLLSCYNAGPGNTLKWYSKYKTYNIDTLYEVLPVEETRHYIRKVMRSYYVYKKLLDGTDQEKIVVKGIL